MSNPLDDRLKNEYSTQYILVIGENSFYPDAASINQDENDEKISESAVVGLDYMIIMRILEIQANILLYQTSIKKKYKILGIILLPAQPSPLMKMSPTSGGNFLLQKYIPAVLV